MVEMKLHHVALCVPEIAPAVEWYSDRLKASVSYQDQSWALLDIDNTSIALVLPSQPPPHLAFESSKAARYGKLTSHHDGTESVYIRDPFENTVEFIKPALEAIML